MTDASLGAAGGFGSASGAAPATDRDPVSTAGARVVGMGRQALLVLPLDPEAVLELYGALSSGPLPGQLDLVPGAESLLVLFAAEPMRQIRAELERRIRRVQVGGVPPESVASIVTWGNARGGNFSVDDTDFADPIPIDTVYDGPDLDEVAALTGLSPEAVIAAHTGTLWQVAFCGFAPGFAYLRPRNPGDRGSVGTEKIDHSSRSEKSCEAPTSNDSGKPVDAAQRGGNFFGSPRDPSSGAASSPAPVLHVPRRDSPRPAIPAGSVGLAGTYSGIYPGPSPGGWQLIGRTDAPLWDLRCDPPALLRPGMHVRFRPVRASMTIHASKPLPAESATPRPRFASASGSGSESARDRHLTVLRPGVQCLIQDLGRAGHASLGVSPSGAADRGAALAANRAVGNPESAPVLEILLGGAAFEADADLIIALAGAVVPVTITAPGQSGIAPAAAEPHTAVRVLTLAAGGRLKLGRPRQGLRVYLALAGGIDVPAVLGSASADVLSHLGPEPVQAGDRLQIGMLTDRDPGESSPENGPEHDASGSGLPEGAAFANNAAGTGVPEGAAFANNAAGAEASADAAALPGGAPPEGSVIVDLTPGPQADPRTLAVLTEATWTVSPESNRVAVRLTGPGLERLGGHTLPSQGLVRGAVQLPPSGELVVFLADYPVTGGYPVIAVAEQADRLAQVRPGASVRFRMAR